MGGCPYGVNAYIPSFCEPTKTPLSMMTGVPDRPAPALASHTTSPPIRRPDTSPLDDSANSMPRVVLRPVIGPASGSLHITEPLVVLSAVSVPPALPTYRCGAW